MSGSNENNRLVALDIGTLSSHLWEAANILRGPVDAADFKTYIFPLLFFKRISDVYDEEFTAALKESNGDVEFAQFPENHRFQIPEGCHWNEIRENDFNLNIPRYVEPVIEEESMTIDEAMDNLKESLKAAYAAEDKLKELLAREGLL